MNPRDPCSWERKLTITFHADDLLMAHVGSDAVAEYAKKLDGVYVTQDPLTVNINKTHE